MNKLTPPISSLPISLGMVVVLSLSIGFYSPKVFADTTSNNNYIIDVNTIDTNPQPTPKPQVLGAQQSIKEFTTGPNYTVNTSSDSFAVGLSQHLVDYGVLSSTNPVIRTSHISFSSQEFGGQILSYQNHPLLSQVNDAIQNTSCDNGSCTPVTASLWTNTLTYGFGYRCTDQKKSFCDTQFSAEDYYKPFADDSRNQTPVSLVFNNGSSPVTQATLTYKVNISGTQKTEGYYNSITYLAVPNF